MENCQQIELNFEGCSRNCLVELSKLSSWKTEGKPAKLVIIFLYSSAFYLFLETRNGPIDGEKFDIF
jgi:hypothetical protein